MKYLNKIKTPSRYSFFIFCVILIIFISILVAIFFKFNIRLYSQDIRLHNKWYSKIVMFWPESSLKRELLERKKTKRYAKSEIKRRFEKQLNSMNFLNTPFYDLWLDKDVEVITNNAESSPQNESFFWPILLDASNKPKIKNSHFIVLPDFKKISVRRGVYLASGESIKSNIPVSNSKRYFGIELLLLSPGHIKIKLGQYVWTRTFFTTDIHKTVKFFIPISDSLAQTYKITNVSSSFYVLDAKVFNVTQNAREPLYMSKNSQIWTGNLKNNVELQQEVDPLTETSNPYQNVERDSTLAKGYNLLFISLDDVDPNFIENSNVFFKLMPSLQNISSTALVLKNVTNVLDYDRNKFKIPIIYKKYGYKTAMFSNTDPFALNDDVTPFNQFDTISKLWLSESDAKFQQKFNVNNLDKKDLDGLNAVFKPEVEQNLKGMGKQEFNLLSGYLKKISHVSNKEKSFSFDDTIVISKKDYIPNLIDSFQKWLMFEKKHRIFVDLTLSNQEKFSAMSIQDLMFLLTKTPTIKSQQLEKYFKMRLYDLGIKQILDALQANYITHRTILVFLLKNKETAEHSSAIVFIPSLKSKQSQKLDKVSLQDLSLYLMSLTGIPTETAIDFSDSYLNIETQKTAMLKNDLKSNNPEYVKYKLIVYPDKNSCQSFIWQASGDQISDIKSNYPFYYVSNLSTIEFFPCAFGENVLEIEWTQNFALNKSIKQNTIAYYTHGYFLPTPKNVKPIELYYGKNLTNYANFPVNLNYNDEQMKTLFFVDEKEFDQLSIFAIKSFQIMSLNSKLMQNTRAALFISKDN